MPNGRIKPNRDERLAVRQELLFGFHILDLFGHPSGMGANFTARVPESDRFFFHIHNYGFGEVTPDHIHKTDFDLKVITGDVAINPTLHIHTQIYPKRSDVMNIVHTHAKHVSALSAIGQNFVHLTQSAARLFEDCFFFDENDGVALGKEASATMANTLGEKSALVLKNHGLLTVGSSIAEAIVLANTMEETAEIQLLAMSAEKIDLPSSSGAQRTKGYLRNEHKISRSWSYLMRNLARERPEVLKM